jgi:hypothetical protein
MTDVATWIQEFVAATGGGALSESDRETILALAGAAARSSERTAAPLTCWVAANAGLSPADALQIAHALAERLADDKPEPNA